MPIVDALQNVEAAVNERFLQGVHVRVFVWACLYMRVRVLACAHVWACVCARVCVLVC